MFIKIKDFYLIWSSREKCPTSWGLDEDALRAWIKEEYGNHGLRDYEENERVRLQETGASLNHSSLKSELTGNQSGPRGVELTEEEIYQAYCLQEPIDIAVG